MRKRLKITRNSAKRSRRLPLTIVVAMAMLAIGAVTVISRQKVQMKEESNDQESRSLATNAASKNYVTVKMAGQDVQVDSQTGQIKELTPEEAQKLAAGLKQMVNKSTKDLPQVQHPDGSVSIDLDGRFQNVTVAKIDKDGTLSQSCVDNPKAAGAFFGIDPKLIEDGNENPEQPARVRPAQTRN